MRRLQAKAFTIASLAAHLNESVHQYVTSLAQLTASTYPLLPINYLEDKAKKSERDFETYLPPIYSAAASLLLLLNPHNCSKD